MQNSGNIEVETEKELIFVLPYIIPGKAIPKLAATYKKAVITTSSISREREITDGISSVLLPSLDEKILAQKKK